jgi:excisionase family DNA binding protein
MSAHLQTSGYDSDRIAQLLTISDVAALLGISRGSVYRLMRSGELVAIRVGERARFDQADVRAYLERNREITPEMREAGFPASKPLVDENVGDKRTAW